MSWPRPSCLCLLAITLALAWPQDYDGETEVEAKRLASRSKESENHVSLVLCTAPEVSVLSSKSRSGINLSLLTPLHVLWEPFGNCLVLNLKVPSI